MGVPVSIFSDLFLFQSFLKIFSVLNVFLILYLQTIRFTVNDVLSLPVIKNFYAVTLFSHYAVYYHPATGRSKTCLKTVD